MRRVKISRWLTVTVVCSLILPTGCAPEAAQKTDATATLALKFDPGDSTTYTVTTERERRIKWEGPVPDDPAFKGGTNRHKIETTFTQEIQSVDDKGDATAKIIIKNIKYASSAKNRRTFNFDTSKPEDPEHPIAMMVGHSYTIKISPKGDVIKVIDVRDAETAARKGSVIPIQALRLLKSDAIKLRHGTLTLPDTGKNQLRTGEGWSDTKSFNFGMMGSESYEKIYTLNKIKGWGKHRTALIKMDAIPASETEQTADLLKNSDIIRTYTGELDFDLAAGKVHNYLEKLQQQWTVAFPSAGEKTDEGPAILTMTETRSYHVEEID